jgi:integrase
MKWQSELKLFKSGKYEYIYVYYKYKNGTIRINTENKYVKSYCNKDLTFNANMPDYVKLNQRTRRLMEKVDAYIFHEFQLTSQSVSQEKCKKYIARLHFDTETKKLVTIDREGNVKTNTRKKLLDFYKDFLDFKRVELKDSPSMKDYKSLENALIDFQVHSCKILSFDIINDKDFFNRFRNYLAAKHKGGKSKGQLNDNTVHKRFSSLKTFMRWCDEQEIFIFKHNLYDFRVQKFNTNIEVLSRDEIRQLEEIVTDKPHWQRIIDTFVCNCFMGLRFGDLNTLEKGKFLQDEQGDYYYLKQNEKTNKPIQISITPTSLRILKKYNFELPQYSNQYFNRELTKILTHYKLFPEPVQKQELRNRKSVVKSYLKRDLIKSHTARRTFITLAINKNVPFNVIQSATGHTQLSTLSKYVKANKDKELISKID